MSSTPQPTVRMRPKMAIRAAPLSVSTRFPPQGPDALGGEGQVRPEEPATYEPGTRRDSPGTHCAESVRTM